MKNPGASSGVWTSPSNRNVIPKRIFDNADKYGKLIKKRGKLLKKSDDYKKAYSGKWMRRQQSGTLFSGIPAV
jgi:hypothetical protein